MGEGGCTLEKGHLTISMEVGRREGGGEEEEEEMEMR